MIRSLALVAFCFLPCWAERSEQTLSEWEQTLDGTNLSKSRSLAEKLDSKMASEMPERLEQTLSEWIQTLDGTNLSKSGSLAKKVDEIDSKIASEMPDLMLFLPSDDAWASHQDLADKFLEDSDSDLRYDLIMASAAEVENTEGDALKSLLVHQNSAGMIYSAYGEPYFFTDDNVMCLGEWDYDARDYVASETICGALSNPVYLKDAIVLTISNVILPSFEDGV